MPSKAKTVVGRGKKCLLLVYILRNKHDPGSEVLLSQGGQKIKSQATYSIVGWEKEKKKETTPRVASCYSTGITLDTWYRFTGRKKACAYRPTPVPFGSLVESSNMPIIAWGSGSRAVFFEFQIAPVPRSRNPTSCFCFSKMRHWILGAPFVA